MRRAVIIIFACLFCFTSVCFAGQNEKKISGFYLIVNGQKKTESTTVNIPWRFKIVNINLTSGAAGFKILRLSSPNGRVKGHGAYYMYEKIVRKRTMRELQHKIFREGYYKVFPMPGRTEQQLFVQLTLRKQG